MPLWLLPLMLPLPLLLPPMIAADVTAANADYATAIDVVADVADAAAADVASANAAAVADGRRCHCALCGAMRRSRTC